MTWNNIQRVKIKGFTLIELMVGLMIALFVFSTTITTYIMIQKFWKGGNTRLILQREARLAAEKIVRRVRGGLEAVVLDGGNTLRLRLDPNRTQTQTDDVWCEYAFTQNTVIFTPDVAAPGTTVILLKNACKDNNRTVFTLNGKNVRIVLGAKDEGGMTGYKSGYVESSATLRNE
jgi:prepilin-type N-terminal cleavage/methylation domain-containing protein